MRIAHLADLHLGFRQYHRQTPQGINQREADVARSFSDAIDQLIARKPDLVMVAGDVFHSVRPTNTAILHAFRQLQRLRRELPETPVILLAGNHDTPRSVETGSILRLFEAIEGVHAVTDQVRRLRFQTPDLSVLCVPHSGLISEEPPALTVDPESHRNVLLLHGVLRGELPEFAETLEFGGAPLELRDLNAPRWDYVALGHYHVAHQVAPNAWYAGSIEYVSRNPWGELKDEEREGRGSVKGWLEVSLGDSPTVEFRKIEPARRLLDLPPIQGDGLSAPDLDRQISQNVASVPEGIADQIVRQVVYDVRRSVARELDHAAIRGYKSEALHFQLDLRRPEIARYVGVGAPGAKQSLSDVVRDYLRRRPLDADLNRDEFLSLGRKFMEEAGRKEGDE